MSQGFIEIAWIVSTRYVDEDTGYLLMLGVQASRDAETFGGNRHFAPHCSGKSPVTDHGDTHHVAVADVVHICKIPSVDALTKMFYYPEWNYNLPFNKERFTNLYFANLPRRPANVDDIFPLYLVTVKNSRGRSWHGEIEDNSRYIVHPDESERMERILNGTDNPIFNLIAEMRYNPATMLDPDLKRAKNDFNKLTHP